MPDEGERGGRPGDLTYPPSLSAVKEADLTGPRNRRGRDSSSAFSLSESKKEREGEKLLADLPAQQNSPNYRLFPDGLHAVSCTPSIIKTL